MSYSFYKVLHLSGIFLIMLSFGGIYINSIQSDKKKWLLAFNGIGLLLALVGGFGLLARLELIRAWPTWVWIKLAIWVIFAILPSISMRKKIPAKVMTLLTLAIAVAAAYFAQFKPF